MKEVHQVDLSKYKAGELGVAVAELLAVPEAVRMVFATVFFTMLLLTFATTLLFMLGYVFAEPESRSREANHCASPEPPALAMLVFGTYGVAMNRRIPGFQGN